MENKLKAKILVKDIAPGLFFEDEFGDICYKTFSKIVPIKTDSGLDCTGDEQITVNDMRSSFYQTYRAIRILTKEESEGLSFNE